MTHASKLSFPLVALAVGLVLLALPGRGQEAPAARYAFADTTLLRDTLGLSFGGLFHLADSLRMLPDSLRALSIRHRLPLARMVGMADSMRVPVDSVGPVLQRERYNPLAATAQRTNSFGYNSGFTVGRSSTTWSNDSDYSLVLSSFFMRNVTNISITRTRDGDLTSRHKARSSNTEIGWKINPDLSFGSRLGLQGTENFKPGSIYNNSNTTNQFDFSIRSRQSPRPGLTSSLNLFGGPFDEPDGIPVKRGFGGEFSGRLSYVRGSWLSHDLNGRVNGKFGRARLPEREWKSTQDLSRDLSGDLGLFNSSPASLRINFRLAKSQFERPDTATTTDTGTPLTQDFIREQPTTGRSVEVALRIQRDFSNYITVTERVARSQTILAVTRDGRFAQDRSSSAEQTFNANGRAGFRGWSLDAGFSNGFPISDQPRRSVAAVSRPGLPDTNVSVYYRERQKVHSRSVDATLSRNLTRRLAFKASGTVSLSSTIQTAFEVTNHTSDNYRQQYRLEALYTGSDRFSTSTRLEVSRFLNLNLLASASNSNREDRSYRADWRWTYRLFDNLTATQQNQIGANYTFNTFASEQNRLALDYRSVTTLNAVVTPRLFIDITHNSRVQPSGGYARETDGVEYFSRSDESEEYTLSGNVTYRPTSTFGLTFSPFYQATRRVGTVDGAAVPTGQYRSLNLAGGASLNLPVGTKGRLTGTITRTFNASRSTRYPTGIPELEPLYQEDYWNGALQLSWQP